MPRARRSAAPSFVQAVGRRAAAEGSAERPLTPAAIALLLVVIAGGSLVRLSARVAEGPHRGGPA
jgi:hypothetical protein